MHWHADGLLTDEDRAKGIVLDWVASIHRPGRTHIHLLVRGKVGMDDLYIEPGAAKAMWKVGRGIASMDHHVGMQFDRSQEMEWIGERMAQTIRREMQMEDRAARRLDREIDL